MAESKLRELSMEFSVDIINLVKFLKSNHESVIANQIGRSGTSIGANIHEGNYASSRADFINKFQIAMKECYETEYWLCIFKDSELITENEYTILFNNCSKIRKLLTASITTAKSNDLPTA